MKLRIKGNSVRLRLTQSEVAQFGETGKIEETLEFGAAAMFVYALETSDAGAAQATFENNRIRIFLPRAQAESWVASNEVGIKAEQPLADGKVLRILVEKDFACLEERPGEDDRDAFPHPETGKAC